MNKVTIDYNKFSAALTERGITKKQLSLDLIKAIWKFLCMLERSGRKER